MNAQEDSSQRSIKMNEQYEKLRANLLKIIGHEIDLYMNDIEKLKGIEQTFDISDEHWKRAMEEGK
jgi:hypothetical protein